MKRLDYVIKKNSRAYCSKCGKKLLQDRYNYIQHEKECGVKFEIFSAINEGECFAYSFDVNNESLIFTGYSLLLTNVRGFTDKFCGAEWKPIFKAEFLINGKEIKEEGMFNVDAWFKKIIDINGIRCLNKENPDYLIRKAFPSIAYLHNYGMFLDIYRQKGYKQPTLSIREIEENDLDTLEKHKNMISNHRTYCIISSVDVNDEIVLKTEFYNGDTSFKAYIGKDIAYFPNGIDIMSYLFKDAMLTLYLGEDRLTSEVYNTVLLRFADRYPELMLRQYIDGGGNYPLRLITAPNCDKRIELIGKAGLGCISDNIPLIEEQIYIHANRLKEMLGMPLKVVRAINSNHGIEFLIRTATVIKSMTGRDILNELYQIQPAIFETPLNAATFDFIRRIYYDSKIKKFFMSNDLLKVIKFIQNINYNNSFTSRVMVEYYIDYIDMCLSLNEFTNGKFPKDIKEAHDTAASLVNIRANEILDKNFTEAINKKEYKSLASNYVKDKDGDPDISDDIYEIIVPKSFQELITESDKLHHCVKTYIEKVATNKTKILFLREKENIEKPFATIEVYNGEVIQLKANCNSLAPISAQEYVKRWAQAKQIKVNSYDIT